MTENQEQAKPQEPETAQEVHYTNMISSLRQYLKEVLNLREGVAIQETIVGIKRDIDFKGPNVWILVCSIFIASIGLNMNSTAVIIGAMLISPLMGPILGMGFSLGTSDFETFLRSIKSFATAASISIITSAFFFWISPIDDPTEELMARTQPTILDAMIAAFGGLAGIIAGSRKEKSNVIPGVAIATALMPPLCTVGFGLANGYWEFAAGAFYLFILNSIFIGAATFLVVKYLGFPQLTFVDKVKQKKYARSISVAIVLLLVPSVWLFYGVIKDSIFNNRANQFVSVEARFDNADVFKADFHRHDSLSTIDLYIIGEPIEPEVQQRIRNRMVEYGLENTKLIFHQGSTSKKEIGQLRQELRVGIVEDMYRNQEKELVERDSIINSLQLSLNRLAGDTIPLHALEAELHIQYNELDELFFAQVIRSNLQGVRDTVPTFSMSWASDAKKHIEDNERIEAWLRVRLKNEKIRVINR